jgi:NitT/TauT family transport system ATP-binding protein
MDEPFGSLDVLTREQMQTWLLDFWNKQKAAVIFVTHDVEEALVLGDRILVLVDGSLRPALTVPFPRPRERKLRYTPEFTEAKKLVREQLRD